MATVLATLDFEGLSDDASFSPASPWVFSVTGGATVWTTQSAAAVHGSMGLRCDPNSSFGIMGYQESSTSATRVIDFYVTPRTLAGGQIFLASLRDGESTARADMRIQSSGVVQIRNVAAAVATSAYALSMDTTYRFAWKLSTVGQELRVYVGESTTPAFTLSGALTSATHTITAIGPVLNSGAGRVEFDTVRVADDWLDPYTPPDPPDAILAMWDGTGLVDVEPLGVWDGEQVAPVETLGVWDGSEIIPVDTPT